ncbi:MAG TPA: hypothetical protein PK167_04385, partial [Prolixibacteraceae bacterium]|nr:hypothetical protein [Prolixibacteraceae bacterium]
NAVSATQVVTVNDTIAPVFVNVPKDTLLTCLSAIPPAAAITVVDNCGQTDIRFSEFTSDSICVNQFKLTRIWTATDNCGNSSSVVQIITVDDTIKPVFDRQPTPLAAVNCIEELPVQEILTASDNCGKATVIASIDDYAGDVCAGFTVTYRWVAVDECGNSAVITATVLVKDTLPPAADPLPDLEPFDCYANIPAPDITVVSGAHDNCNGLVQVTHVGDSGNPGCAGVVTRLYRITYECGNSTDLFQQIHVKDTIAPVADPLPVLGPFACIEDVPAPDIASVTGVIDNCNNQVSVSFREDIFTAGCSGTVQRIYLLTDECGNSSQVVQNILINDTIPPTADPLPDLGPFDCYANIPAPDVAAITGAQDNCNGLVQVAYVGDSGDPGCEGTVTRTYLLSDGCGNSREITQLIHIKDTVPPTVPLLPELGPYNCYADIPPANISLITGAYDNCGRNFTITISGDSGDPGCEGIVTRTYVVEDECGSSVEVQQIIHIRDTLAPVANPLPNLGPFECYADIPAPDISVVKAIDNCGKPVVVTFVSDSEDPGCEGVVTRVYRITDECGNSREIIQLIHIKDDVPPTADLLLPIEPFECYGAIPPADISTVTGAADNCSEVTVTFLSDSDDPGCEGKVFRTFRLTDECGNYYDLVQTILVKDTIRPVIKSLPPDLTLDCKAPLPHAKFEDFVAAGGDISDNCGIDLNSFGFIKDTVVSNGCPRIIHRIYLVADYCGNGIRFTQKITITDDEPPALSCPPDVTLTFGEKIPAPYATYASFLTAGGTASDNCEIDESSFTFVTETITRNSQYDLFTRIYRIADWCGNEETCTQVIYRERPVVPTINCPIETELECVGELPAPYTTLLQFIQAGASVSAECPIDTASFRLVFEHSDGKTCPEVISRTYEISDTCGNTVQCVQLWKLDDQTPPQMSCPPEVTVPIGTPVPAVFTTYLQFFGAGGVATDNCGVDESSFLLVSEVVKPGILTDSVYRTYQIADFCGNLATCQHLLYLQKDAETQISCPPMAEPECVGDVPAPLTSFAEYLAAGGSASSKCGIDQASFRLVSETSDGKRCPETITRLYEISDLCGNTVQCKHLIRVTDNNPPQMACPPDTTVKTHDQIPPAFTTFAQFVAGGGMAYDRCKLDENSFVLYREVSDGKSYPETITRTYHIADSCGNFAICEQKIIVKGDAATFINCPNDLGYECFGDVPAPLATYAAFEAAGGSAGSNCGINPASFLLVSENITGNCPRIITRIYEISDNCGNTVRCTQRIIVNDITNPVVTCLPNIEVLPNQSIPAAHFNLAAFRAAGGTATDNCGLREETFTTIDEVNISDPRIINRIYSVLDSCGNRGYCIQTITLITDAETQINCPGTLTVDCINNIPERYKTFAEFRAAGGNASSLCGIDESTFTWIEDKSDGKHCPETISRTYSITDKCGFTAICTQTIVVDDNEKPRFTVWPRVPSTECLIASPYASYAEFTAAGGRITDNCGLDEASFRKTGNDVVDGNSCNRTITRTYQIADLCGNVGIFIQTLTIQDTRPPVMILEPEDISVTCSLNIPKPYANMAEFTTAGGFVTDNCGSVPHIKFIKDEMLAGGCPRIVNRTYHFTDDCGNTLVWVQAITVNDNIPPQIIKKPANINLACITPPPFANYAEFTAAGGEATDNCRIVSFQLVQENWIGVSCPKTLQRTYQVADECGNTDSFTHLITIDDKEAPQMSCPPSLVVEVAAGQTVPPSFTSLAAYLAGGGSVSDNCQVDERTFRMLGERINDYDCERSIIRQYTIADFCGNADTCTHIIYTEKVALPEITCPTDLTVSCISDIPPV